MVRPEFAVHIYEALDSPFVDSFPAVLSSAKTAYASLWFISRGSALEELLLLPIVEDCQASRVGGNDILCKACQRQALTRLTDSVLLKPGPGIACLKQSPGTRNTLRLIGQCTGQLFQPVRFEDVRSKRFRLHMEKSGCSSLEQRSDDVPHCSGQHLMKGFEHGDVERLRWLKLGHSALPTIMGRRFWKDWLLVARSSS